jgi:hypothetical protein
MPVRMTDDLFAQALNRIERAMGRIETAAAMPQTGDSEPAKALGALQGRHDMLRAETKKALAELEALISRASAGATH